MHGPQTFTPGSPLSPGEWNGTGASTAPAKSSASWGFPGAPPQGKGIRFSGPSRESPAPNASRGMAMARVDGRSSARAPSCGLRQGEVRQGEVRRGAEVGISGCPPPIPLGQGRRLGAPVSPTQTVLVSAPRAPTPAVRSYLRPGLSCPQRALRGQLGHSGALRARGRSRLGTRCAPSSP